MLRANFYYLNKFNSSPLVLQVYTAGSKPHTRFPAPGWDNSQTSEEDSLPLLQPAPRPQVNTPYKFLHSKLVASYKNLA